MIVAANPEARNRSSRTAFAVVAIALFCAALTLNLIVTRYGLSFQKARVEPAKPLKMLAADLGPWVQISLDRPLNPDFEHELGAAQYLFRDYLDTRLIPEKNAKALRAASIEDREKLRRDLGALDPKALVRFALTYYTGSVDTVPHVPDRCYAADGFKPDTWEVVDWPILPRASEAERHTKVRLINFVDQIDSRHSQPKQVSYFFQVNGSYEDDPIFGVRMRLQNLFERKAYFCKIELVTDLSQTSDAQVVMSDFLTHAMPEIEHVLPDWSKVVQ